jgi:5-methylthioadenosine/S-adenosylhomocysteine deaminase
MPKRDNLKFQGGAATNTEGEQGNEGRKNRDHAAPRYGGDAKISRFSPRFGVLSRNNADLLMLKADNIDVWPLNNAYGAVVNLMGPSHVEAVFIAGQVRKWRGNLVGVDMRHVLRSMQQARDGVLRRANFPINLFG